MSPCKQTSTYQLSPPLNSVQITFIQRIFGIQFCSSFLQLGKYKYKSNDMGDDGSCLKYGVAKLLQIQYFSIAQNAWTSLIIHNRRSG